MDKIVHNSGYGELYSACGNDVLRSVFPLVRDSLLNYGGHDVGV